MYYKLAAVAVLVFSALLQSCGGQPTSDGSASSSGASSSSSSTSSSSTSSSSSSNSSSTSSTSSSGSSSSSSTSSSSSGHLALPVTGRYSIFARESGLPLEVAEYSYDNGAAVRLWEPLGLLNQRFDVVDLENGYYALLAAHSGKSLDVKDRSMDDGGPIQQYSYISESQQQWQFKPTGDGYYTIVSKISGKALEVWNGRAEPGAEIRQFGETGQTHQQWSLSPEPPPHSFDQLVWSDEFNYEGLPDEAYWSYERGMVRNNEAQYYTVARPENVDVRNGLLTITARREPYEEASYTSASLHTRDKKSWTYGRFEVRARIDTRAGMWPAFWMLGPGKWPEGGEIDIMEYYNGKILANVAWKANNSDAWSAAWDSATQELRRLRFQHPDWDDRFHVWHMDWSEDEIRLYVDNILMNSTKLSDVSNPDGSNPFIGKPFYLMLNLAIGGNNGGDPSGTSFPATYEIDYVRVYQ